MASTKIADGICSTCKFILECRILKRSQAEGKVIWHCEAFDDPNLTVAKEREKKIPIVMRSNNLIPGWDL